jgi:L-aminopeptidase/D-esterase-like protein
MQHEPTLDDGTLDNAILGRLCEAGPLAVSELVRELGPNAKDGLGRLVEKGLAHRLEGDFVIASAAGRHANTIDPTWR